MNRALRLGLILSLGLCAGGCPLFFDVETVELHASTMDSAIDATSDAGKDADTTPTDMQPPDDLGGDVRDVGDDTGPDADATIVDPECVAEPGTIEGECSPVEQDCPNMQFCDFQLVSSDPVVFETRCRPLDESLDYVLTEDEPCQTNPDTETCEVGLKCRIDRCTRLCRLDDGTGCQGEQVCAEFAPDIPEFGICLDEC